MSNQNKNPKLLQEGTEKKGGMNEPPKSPKPDILPAGQKKSQPKK